MGLVGMVESIHFWVPPVSLKIASLFAQHAYWIGAFFVSQTTFFLLVFVKKTPNENLRASLLVVQFLTGLLLFAAFLVAARAILGQYFVTGFIASR